jgi:nitrite reductase/ring-hydroxylating ferredoxin subunit
VYGFASDLRDVENRKMAFVKVGTLAELPAGSVMEATLGERTFAICNLNGELHALDGSCPHVGGPLGQGNLEGSTLICPWHCWEFDCRTGANEHNEDLSVRKFDVRVENGDILINAD